MGKKTKSTIEVNPIVDLINLSLIVSLTCILFFSMTQRWVMLFFVVEYLYVVRAT